MKRRTFLRTSLAALSFVLSAASSGLHAALAQVSAMTPRPRRIRLPPVPKWNKATDDMDSMDFLQRCQDCERALLPSDIIFPRPGQIWETLHDCEVHVQKRMIGTRGPMFGLNANLKQGERVLILPLAHTKPLQIIFQPLRYDELHQTIASGSLSYELSLMTTRVISGFGPSTGYFIELFKLVQDVV